MVAALLDAIQWHLFAVGVDIGNLVPSWFMSELVITASSPIGKVNVYTKTVLFCQNRGTDAPNDSGQTADEVSICNQ